FPPLEPRWRLRENRRNRSLTAETCDLPVRGRSATIPGDARMLELFEQVPHSRTTLALRLRRISSLAGPSSVLAGVSAEARTGTMAISRGTRNFGSVPCHFPRGRIDAIDSDPSWRRSRRSEARLPLSDWLL